MGKPSGVDVRFFPGTGRSESMTNSISFGLIECLGETNLHLSENIFVWVYLCIDFVDLLNKNNAFPAPNEVLCSG